MISWINTSELSEFGKLLGHAANLGLDGVWIYGFMQDNGQSTPHNNTQWTNISYAAYNAGYLRRFDEKLCIYWKCSYGNPCVCDPNDPEGWVIDRILSTGYVYEY